jgi:hypothetical protein
MKSASQFAVPEWGWAIHLFSEKSIFSKIIFKICFKTFKGFHSKNILLEIEYHRLTTALWNVDNSVSYSTQLDIKTCQQQLVLYCTEWRVPLAHSQLLTFSNSAVRIMCHRAWSVAVENDVAKMHIHAYVAYWEIPIL